MATTTTNFGWDIPQSTDLVKDGATAIAALGQDIDTAMVDLKGGTTGQVLAKASGTDLDFSWVAQDDSNAIQNAIVDAKGDLIGATAADTPARLAVGTNGQILTADSTAATGLAWATPATAGGLTLITAQTIGSGVSTVTVSSAFSSTYDNYRIIISGGVGSGTDRQLRLTLGATATGYYRFAVYGSFTSNTIAGEAKSNQTYWQGVGTATTAAICSSIDLLAPNLAKNTTLLTQHVQNNTGGVAFWLNGLLDDTTQYTAFTIAPEAGTLTGGTIRVYGYQNS
jgi:hypothetical protein